MVLAELRPVGCDEVRPRLSEYLDRELPAEDRMRVFLHLSGCAPCRIEADALGRLVQAMHALGARRRRGALGQLS